MDMIQHSENSFDILLQPLFDKCRVFKKFRYHYTIY